RRGLNRPERPHPPGARLLLLEVLGVHRDEVLPFVRSFVQRKDGFHRAGRDAGAAVDALVGMDIEHLRRRKLRFVLARMDTVHGTHVHAGRVLRAYARFRDDVRHEQSPKTLSVLLLYTLAPAWRTSF